VRKEYSTRRWFRVYANRIETNSPHARFPFGYLGCGSWNADDVTTHVFDRGAFGFQKVRCLTIDYLCCIWPVYGETVARQRCQCNGPLWNRMLTDCGKFLFFIIRMLGGRIMSMFLCLVPSLFDNFVCCSLGSCRWLVVR
jgi:hypothetical protein